MQIRPSLERGYEDKGWLQTFHTFSFDTYYDQNFMNYRTLRVINEDTIAGGKGFPSHFHKDMEIITYVLEGVLEHQDSLGNASVIRPGEVQRMTAGSGITHSEYNLSHELPVHFLQIWINPSQHGLPPGYQQKAFSTAAKWGQWCLLASGNGRNGSLHIHQDVDLYSTLLETGEETIFQGLADRYYWVQVVSGKFLVHKQILSAGDGASLRDEELIEVSCLEGGELLLFDLA